MKPGSPGKSFESKLAQMLEKGLKTKVTQTHLKTDGEIADIVLAKLSKLLAAGKRKTVIVASEPAAELPIGGGNSGSNSEIGSQLVAASASRAEE